MFKSAALRTIAFASACSEYCSKPAVNASSSSAEICSLKEIISAICILPVVNVPVLSKTTVSTLPISSKAEPDLIKTPFFAA